MATEPWKIEVDHEAVSLLVGSLNRKLSDMTPFFEGVGQILVDSIHRNFEEGGRYSEVGDWRGGGEKWEPNAPATLKKKKGPKVLFEQGHLFDSVNYAADSYGVAVGSNLAYAAIHSFGGKAGRGLLVNIPARPYLVVQDEDLEDIDALGAEFLNGGL